MRKMLRAANAVSANRFCIAIHEQQSDDPFSIILDYNGAMQQPWSRTDVQRNITAVTAKHAAHALESPYVAVSDEGDVHFLEREPLHEKIPGAGIHSDDADGSGGIEGVTYLHGKLTAFGSGGQMHERSVEGVWKRTDVSAQEISKQGRFSTAVEGDATNAYAVGTIVPQFWKTPEDLRAAQLEAAAAGDLELFTALSREGEKWAQDQGFAKMEKGFLAFRNEAGWRQLDTVNDHVLRDIFVVSAAEIWIVGGGGDLSPIVPPIFRRVLGFQSGLMRPVFP